MVTKFTQRRGGEVKKPRGIVLAALAVGTSERNGDDEADGLMERRMGNSEYVALLRGINVSGHKPVKMDALRGLFESLGFSAVETLIRSGNVRFMDTGGDAEDALAARIAEAAERAFGSTAPLRSRR